MVLLDVRLNPGCTPKLLKNFSLGMLKNIEILKDRGINIQKKWLVPEIYGYKIPLAILKGLGLRSIGEKEETPTSPRRKSSVKTRDRSVKKS